MNVSVMAHTCTGGSAPLSISLVGPFLQPDDGVVGDAIAQIDIYLCLDEPGSQDEFETPFDVFIRKLPLCTFSRAKKRIELQFLSKVGDARLTRDHEPHAKLPLFVNTAKEIAGMLLTQNPKLGKSAARDYDAFRAFVEKQIYRLPTTEHEFVQLQARLRQKPTAPVIEDEEDSDELWVMIKTDEFFGSDADRQIGEELVALVERERLGVNDGRSSGSHQFDVNFYAVKNFEKAKSVVSEFLRMKYPQRQFVVSAGYESTFDIPRG